MQGPGRVVQPSSKQSVVEPIRIPIVRQSSFIYLDGRSVPFSLVAVRDRIPQVPLLALRGAFPRFPG